MYSCDIAEGTGIDLAHELGLLLPVFFRVLNDA
jgi:hypothetical protein